MRKPYVILVLLILLAFLVVGLIVGCGSGNGNKSVTAINGKSASLVITIKWPKTTRLIPLATASIKVDIANKAVLAPGNIVTSIVIAPTTPVTTTTITPLPSGNLTMTATALDANGAAISRGKKDVTTQVNVAAQVSINMDSTIDQITVTPANPTVSVQSTMLLQTGGVNTDKEMVLLTPSKLEWTSTDATIATVDAQSGLVTGVKQGTANIQVTDTEASKSAAVTVTVTAQNNGTGGGSGGGTGGGSGGGTGGTEIDGSFAGTVNSYTNQRASLTVTATHWHIDLSYPFGSKIDGDFDQPIDPLILPLTISGPCRTLMLHSDGIYYGGDPDAWFRVNLEITANGLNGTLTRHTYSPQDKDDSINMSGESQYK